MNIEFERSMAMLSGQSNAKFDLNRLSDGDRAEINHALDMLMEGLSLQNWLTGGTLRCAWGNTIEQVRIFVAKFTEINPAVRYVRDTSHEKCQKMDMMRTTSVDGDRHINCPVDERDNWTAMAAQKIQYGTTTIARKIKEFVSGTPRATTPQVRAPQMQISRERERERER